MQMRESVSWPASDVPLEERVRFRLDGNGSAAFGGVVVEANEGAVLLKGVVASYYAKQLAQEFAKRIPGVSGVINLIEVREAT